MTCRASMTKSKLFWPILLLILAVIAFFAYRLISLNAIPVFVDEAIYVRWSQVMRAEATLRFIPLSDGKQPLFMWITIPFLKFFSDPLIAGRMVSVAAGVGSMVALFLVSQILFENIILSSLASLIYAILPFSVFFDRMALADSLLSMFGLWSIYFSVLFAKTKRLDHAMILGFFIGGGLITKSPAIIYYFWTLLAVIFFGKINFSKKEQIKSLFFGAVAIVLISQGINSILRLGPGFSQIASRNQDYVFSWREVLQHPFNPLTGNLKSTVSWLWLLFTPSIFITALLGFLDKKRIKQALFILLVSLAPLIAQAFIAKVYTSRYILYASIPLIILSSLGIYWLLQRKGVIIKALGVISLLIPVIVSAIYVIDPLKAPMSYDMRNGYLEEWTAGWGNKEIAQYLIAEESAGNKVVVFTEGYFGTMPDGLQIYTEGHKNITVVGSPPDVRRIPEGLLNSAKTNKNYLVVNQSRDHLSPADLAKLTLIKEFPKPTRIDGTHETLQFFELK